ncbi:MAG: transglycosylase domain-containing protein [bacterium]
MEISHKKRHIIRNIIFAILGLGAIIFGVLILWISTLQLPDFSSFDSRKQVNSTKVYDRTGTIVLYDLGSDIHRTNIPYTDMGATIKNATVAIEDSNFYNNPGIEIKSMVRALIADITHAGAVQGGSTITQQVIKQSLLSNDKTIVRKLKEVILSLKLEREYNKDEILGIYLNEIPYGGNTFGISEAAETFFGKKPADLTLAEAAYLAAIPNAPTHYSPYGAYKSDLDSRKNLVLTREHELKFITDAEFAQAKNEKVTFLPQQPQGIKAPHFVFFIKDYLEQKYGSDVVETGGLKVITTLDYGLQQAAENAVTTYTTGAKKQIDDENSGLVAIDPKTGQILVMVGSRNYFDKEIDGNYNVTTAKRQPGSSFKPYVYVTAFEKGFTPETMLMDVPTEFNSSCDPYGHPLPGHSDAVCYMPNDFDNKFRGPMSIRNALAGSINVPAVQTLYIVGINNAIKTAQDMGITTLTDPSRYGLSLVLGGGEVKLLDMVSAYSVFATEGYRHPYSGILSVTDKDGNTLESWSDNQIQVLPRNPTLQISSILSDNKARTATFGANSYLNFSDRDVAVKSGTTNDNKDSWAVGYTPSLVVGVWLGKNDNTSMPVNITAAPIWHMFMQEALKNYPVEYFDKPVVDSNYNSLPPVLRGHFEGNQEFTIDTISGGLATPNTPIETQKEEVVTDVHNILHWISKNNILGGVPSNPSSDSLYYNWETATQNWWATHSSNYPIVTLAQKPTFDDNVHIPANQPHVAIISPTTNNTFKTNQTITVKVDTSGTYPLQKIDVFMNNVYVGSTQGLSPTFSFSPSDIKNLLPGPNTLMVTATDWIYNKASVSEVINISQ